MHTFYNPCLTFPTQFDYAIFIPNAPILLHKPPPTTKGQTSQENILEILPNVGETAAFAAMLVLLSEQYSDQVKWFLQRKPPARIIKTFKHKKFWIVLQTKFPRQAAVPFCVCVFWQVFLGTYPEQRFDEPATEDMIDKFQEELSLLSEAITTRNAKLEIPYTYLNPSIIENSISI